MARRILIADDTVNNRIAFKAALSAARYDVTSVASAKEAVISLEEHGADLLLIDAALPDLSSSGVLSQLQSDDPSVPPCIVMTSEEKPRRGRPGSKQGPPLSWRALSIGPGS